MPIPVLCGPYSLLHPDPPRQRGGGAKIVIFNKEVLHAVSKSAVQHPPQMSNEATPYEEDTNLADRRQGIANSFRVSVRYRGSGGNTQRVGTALERNRATSPIS
jgi:hypothetical protein